MAGARGAGGAQRLAEQKPSSGSLACVATINAIAPRCIHTPLRFMQNSPAATPARGFIDEFARAFPLHPVADVSVIRLRFHPSP